MSLTTPFVRIAFLAIATAAGCAGLPGCISFHTTKNVEVRVVDAETGAPISWPEIRVWYASAYTLNPPKIRQARGDELGRCTIPVANFSFGLWEVKAPGYLERREYLKKARVPMAFRPPKGSGNEALVTLFGGPSPSFELVVPQDFSGWVRVQLVARQRRASDQAGQRRFSFAVPADGRLSIEANQLLRLHNPFQARFHGEIQVRRADGQQIPMGRAAEMNDPTRSTAIWWWCLNRDVVQDKILLFIGTNEQARSADRMLYTYSAQGGRSPSKSAFDAFFEPQVDAGAER
jgi:hypothetical protein